MIDTLNLVIRMIDGDLHFLNISRVAAKRYLDYYRENEKFRGYTLDLA